MLAHLPSTFRGRRLCASVSQPVSRRGSRFVAFPLWGDVTIQAAPKTRVDEILPYIPS
jgi:hypothetical protein